MFSSQIGLKYSFPIARNQQKKRGRDFTESTWDPEHPQAWAGESPFQCWDGRTMAPASEGWMGLWGQLLQTWAAESTCTGREVGVGS